MHDYIAFSFDNDKGSEVVEVRKKDDYIWIETRNKFREHRMDKKKWQQRKDRRKKDIL